MSTVVNARHLLAGLLAAAQTRSTDKFLPLITGIHVKAEGEKVTIAGTDRYVLSLYTAPCHGGDIDLVLDYPSSKLAITGIKAAGRDAEVTIEARGPEGATIIVPGVGSFEIKTIDQNCPYPPLGKLIDGHNPGPTAHIMVHPDQLSKLIRASKEVRTAFAPHFRLKMNGAAKMMLTSAETPEGVTWAGGIMPQREPEGE